MCNGGEEHVGIGGVVGLCLLLFGHCLHSEKNIRTSFFATQLCSIHYSSSSLNISSSSSTASLSCALCVGPSTDYPGKSLENVSGKFHSIEFVSFSTICILRISERTRSDCSHGPHLPNIRVVSSFYLQLYSFGKFSKPSMISFLLTPFFFHGSCHVRRSFRNVGADIDQKTPTPFFPSGR